MSRRKPFTISDLRLCRLMCGNAPPFRELSPYQTRGGYASEASRRRSLLTTSKRCGKAKLSAHLAAEPRSLPHIKRQSAKRFLHRRRRLMFRIVERSLHHLRADAMSDGFDSDLNFDLRSRTGKLALQRCQRDHLFQEWRPGRRSRFTYLVAIAVNRHHYSRGNR